MECKFCKSILKNKTTLKFHVENSKKCIHIQTLNKVNVISALISCQHCGKTFSKPDMVKHLGICKTKNKSTVEKLEIENAKLTEQVANFEKKIQELNLYIAKLETRCDIYREDHDIVASIAQQPKNTTNNIINLSTLDMDVIKDRFYDTLVNIIPSDLYDGQAAIGRMIAPCLKNEDNTNMLACTDYSRGVFTYKDDQGNLNKDIKCQRLAKMIEPIASARACEVFQGVGKSQSKFIRMSELNHLVQTKENEIDSYRQTLKDLVYDTSQWKLIDNLIAELLIENMKYRREIAELERDMDDDKGCEDGIYDSKLLDGMNDIKEMRNDSTKFSKAVSEHI